MKSLFCVAAGIVLLIILSAGAVVGETYPVRVTSAPLNGHLYLLTSASHYEANQVASVGADGILLVDVGWTATAPKLKETVALLGNGRVRLIVNTHGHDDHASGNRIFRDESIIVGQRNVPDAMGNRYYSLAPMSSPNAPEVLVDGSLTIMFNGEQVHLVHWPSGHSSGDLVVQFMSSNVVCVGDLAFPDHFPYIDLSVGGNATNYLAYVKRLVDSFPPETRYVAGHGRVFTHQDMVAYYDELMKQREIVRAGLAGGKTVADLQHDSVLAAWNAWSGPWVTTDANYWIATLATSVVAPTATKASICAPVTETLVREGTAAAIARYRDLKTSRADQYEFGENELNTLGYNLLMRQMMTEAVEIFKLNTEMFPKSFNVFDSYGEVLLAKGDTAQSIVNYKKSLKLNPNNTNAADVLKKLGVK